MPSTEFYTLALTARSEDEIDVVFDAIFDAMNDLRCAGVHLLDADADPEGEIGLAKRDGAVEVRSATPVPKEQGKIAWLDEMLAWAAVPEHAAALSIGVMLAMVRLTCTMDHLLPSWPATVAAFDVALRARGENADALLCGLRASRTP